MRGYARHLATSGVLAVHVSNHYLDLEPIVYRLAAAEGYEVKLIDFDESDQAWWDYGSTWMLLSHNHALIETPLIAEAAIAGRTNTVGTPLWTDEFASLYPILKPSKANGHPHGSLLSKP